MFSDRENFKIYMLMIQVYLPSGGCVDDVVNSQTNLQFTSIIVEHFMIAQEIIRRTVFDVYVCLNHIYRYKYNQFKRRAEKQNTSNTVFSTFRQFLYLDVFRKWQKSLTCSCY